MNPTVKEHLQKYITVIENGLADPEPNFIALQIAIDNFISILPSKLKGLWLREQEKITGFPKYISNNNQGGYREVFENFLSRIVKPEIASIKEEELISDGLNPEQLKALVEEHQRHLQEVKTAETGWKEKWQSRFREQIKKANQAVIYQVSQIDTNALPGDKDQQKQIIDAVILGAKELQTHPINKSLPEAEQRQVAQKLIVEKVLKREKDRLKLWMGLSKSSTDALLKTMMLMSAEESDLAANILRKENLTTDLNLRQDLANMVVEGAGLLRKNEGLLAAEKQKAISEIFLSNENYQKTLSGLPSGAISTIEAAIDQLSDSELIKNPSKLELAALKEAQKITPDYEKQRTLVAVAMSGAVAVHRIKDAAQIQNQETINRIFAEEKIRNILIGLSPDTSPALARAMRYISKTGFWDMAVLPGDLTEESLQKKAFELAQISTVVEASKTTQIPGLNLLSSDEKNQVVETLSEYLSQYLGLLKNYQIDVASPEFEQHLRSHPLLLTEINNLQDKYLLKLRQLNISSLSPAELKSLLQNPNLFFAALKLKTEGQPLAGTSQPARSAVVIGKTIARPIQNVWLNIVSYFQIIVHNIIVRVQTGGFFKGAGNAFSSLFSNAFNGIIGSTRSAIARTSAEAVEKAGLTAAAKTVGKKFLPLSSTTTQILIMLGLVVLVVGTGFSMPPGRNIIDMTDTAAFVNNPSPPPEQEIDEVFPGWENPTGPVIAPELVPCIPTPENPCLWPTKGSITYGPWGPPGHTGNISNSVDIGAATGTSVTSPFSGVVIRTETRFDDDQKEAKSYGNYVLIKVTLSDGSTFTAMFSHMQRAGIEGSGLAVGDTVSVGQVIGTVDNNGNSTGPHLHYEIRGGPNINSLLPYEVPPCGSRSQCHALMGDKSFVSP